MLKFLRVYRCTPHVMTEFTPHRLMFSRDPQTKLPEVRQHVSADDEVVRGNDAAAKLKMKSRADKRTRAKMTTLNEGHVVLVRPQNTGRLPELWLAFATGRSFGFLAAHEIAKALGQNKCQALHFFHAFTGCDIVSCFQEDGVRKLHGKHGNQMVVATVQHYVL